jgi:hypothetical protein
MDGSQLWLDFSEFVEASRLTANQSGRRLPPKELPFETAYNDPPENAFLSILYQKIELNRNHTPTRRGWKTLSRFLAVYRSKQYETVRYLLLDSSGEIVDHVAITNRIPDRASISPDFIDQGTYFRRLSRYVCEQNYKIILVHNHPSGNVLPSEQDKNITAYLMRSFGNTFAGHLILDHGSFALYLPGKDWEIVSQKSVGYDPLVKPGRDDLFNYNLSGGLTADKITLLRCAMKVDGGDRWNSRDWVAVVFTSGWGHIKALHYYHTSDFYQQEAAQGILKKTVDIACRSGAVWAFAFSDNPVLLEPIQTITRETGVFRDFQVNGITGTKLGIGGSISKHFSHAAETISTVLIDTDRNQQSPGQDQNVTLPAAAAATDTITKAAYYFFKEGHTMEDRMVKDEDGLSQREHLALVEFLSVCGNRFDAPKFDAFYNSITALRDFKFLKDYVPRQGEENWLDYHEFLNDRYKMELHRYHQRFPDLPYPELSSRPSLKKNGERVPHTPSDFLEAAVKVSTVEEYREVCGKFPSFDKGTVKAVSPRKIALFHESAALPLLLADNTPENWAKLYTKANDNGIAVNSLIPGPDDVKNLGIGIIRAAAEHWKNARSEQWQLEEYRRTCAQDRHSSDQAALLKAFCDHPYTAGTAVPPFILQDESGVTTYTGFSFKSTDDNDQSLTLARKSPEGNEETVTISSRLYKTMIDNAGITLKKPETTPEVLRLYDRMIARDAEETRSNTAANFWHNYRILCRQQASNPQEAMEVAKAIVGQMSGREQEKLKRNIKAYEAATRKLVNNPLLRPFVKPQETYNQRILNYYEENVKDLPIKDTTVNGGNALVSIRHGVTSIDTPGQKIDPALHVKIGDTVKLSLDCKTLFGESRKRLPVTGFTVVSASDDLNKIVLLDKTGNSKYTLTKDAFTEKMRKLERKLEKHQRKQDKYESIRY